MSIDSKNIGQKFLSEDYSKRQDDGEWKNRRTPPNSFERVKAWDETTVFQIAIPTSLQKKMDGMQGKTQVTELPPGYSIVMTLYKDQEFMTKVRFQNKPIVDAYLNEHHPLVVNYLKVHGLRVVSQVIGLNDVDRRRILLASKDEDGDSVSAAVACAVSSGTAIAAVSGGASVGAVASAAGGIGASGVAAATAAAGAVACAVGSVAGSDADKDKDKDGGKDKDNGSGNDHDVHGDWH